MNEILGYMSEYECQTLASMFQKFNFENAVGVEIGSLHGRSAFAISNAIPLGRLFCIDTWAGGPVDSPQFPLEYSIKHKFPIPGSGNNLLSIFLNNMKLCKNINAIKACSPYDISDWDLKCDFCFIDSEHENPNDKDNIDFWLPKIRQGGILSGHDYSSNMEFPAVHENVTYLETLLGRKVTNPPGTSIWYFNI